MSQPAELYATKSDFAYMRVRDLILSGELEPGAALNQETLARQIGISTTPLREALRRLAQNGLITMGAHRDARVATLDAEEARDLLELRRVLDPMAASLAAERRTKTDIAQIRLCLDGLKPLPDDVTVTELVAHREFHAAIYRSSHNDLLISTLDGLWDKADRYRLHGLQVHRDDAERAERAQEHTALLDHIVAGDGESAAAVMRQHIDHSLGAKAAWRLKKPLHSNNSR